MFTRVGDSQLLTFTLDFKTVLVTTKRRIRQARIIEVVLRSLEQPLLLDFPAWTFAFPKVLYSDAWLTPDNPGPVQARVKTITRLASLFARAMLLCLGCKVNACHIRKRRHSLICPEVNTYISGT